MRSNIGGNIGSNIIVTNDDGLSSPLLLPLIKELSGRAFCGTLLAVVPASEQSWIADAMSRFRELTATPHQFGEIAGFMLDGTPADCASIGIHNLAKHSPDLVISGINMGTNASLPFFLCSGTVGAVTQAFLNGVPGIALSCVIPPEVFSLWMLKDIAGLNAKFAERFAQVAKYGVRVCERLVKAQAMKAADFYSVNLPWEINAKSELRITRLARATFRTMFAEVEPGHFSHRLTGFDFPEGHNGSSLPEDLAVLETGAVSITPVKFEVSCEVSELLKQQITGTVLGD